MELATRARVRMGARRAHEQWQQEQQRRLIHPELVYLVHTTIIRQLKLGTIAVLYSRRPSRYYCHCFGLRLRANYLFNTNDCLFVRSFFLGPLPAKLATSAREEYKYLFIPSRSLIWLWRWRQLNFEGARSWEAKRVDVRRRPS